MSSEARLSTLTFDVGNANAAVPCVQAWGRGEEVFQSLTELAEPPAGTLTLALRQRRGREESFDFECLSTKQEGKC